MTKSRLPWAVLAILLANVPSLAAEIGRGTKEAVYVFGVIRPIHVLSSMEGAPTPCLYDRNWQSGYAVPQDLARNFFGPRSGADLSAGEPGLNPEDVLDPRHEYAEAFCTATEKETFKKAHLTTFEKDKATKEFRTRDISYSFPTFNDDYTKAVIVAGESTEEHRRAANGKIVRDLPEAALVVHFLVKVSGRWKLVRSEVLGLT